MENNLKRNWKHNTNVTHISLKTRNCLSLDSILPPTRMDFYNSALLIATSIHESEERLSAKQKLVGILPYYVNFISVGPSISPSSGFFSFPSQQGYLKSFPQKGLFVLSTNACNKYMFSTETRSFLLYKWPRKVENISLEMEGLECDSEGFCPSSVHCWSPLWTQTWGNRCRSRNVYP